MKNHPIRERCGAAAVVFLAFGPAPGRRRQKHCLPPALSRVLAGNARFIAHKERHPDESLARRRELVSAQHPFAIVLGCADSRVPPELLFDEGLVHLFVIRVAGNVVDDMVLTSLEYAVEHPGTKLIVVLGHEKWIAAHYELHTGKVRLLDSRP